MFSILIDSTNNPEISGTLYIISSLLSLAALVARCKIFSDNDYDWWRALIPLLDIYTFGEIVDDRETGKKALICYALVGPVAAFSIVLLLSFLFMPYSEKPWLEIIATILVFITFIGIIVCIVLEIIYIMRLRSKYIKLKGEQSWLLVIWFFFSFLTEIYLAFFTRHTENVGYGTLNMSRL
jgi:hypothetical protein